MAPEELLGVEHPFPGGLDAMEPHGPRAGGDHQPPGGRLQDGARLSIGIAPLDRRRRSQDQSLRRALRSVPEGSTAANTPSRAQT